MTDPIVWLEQVGSETASAVAGAKMGRLSELIEAGITVPRGFSVSIDAYRRHCSESGLDSTIDRITAGVHDVSDQAAIEAASQAVKDAFAQTPILPRLADGIVEAYQELAYRCCDVNVPVAVRSSATGEDSGAASFAGIFDTYLGVSGDERVLTAVRDCWASLFTPRALAYRLTHGISHHDMPMAVGVIELVHARSSGVAFSVHPVSGKNDRIVIEGSWGWGEAVVQGLVTPDHIEVGKSDGRVLSYDTATKKIVSTFDFAAGRVVEVDMPARLQDAAALDEEHITAITTAVTAIERHYGHPVDVEWVLDRHRRAGEPICVVQTRPVTVTTARNTAAAPPVWDPVAAATRFAFQRKR